MSTLLRFAIVISIATTLSSCAGRQSAGFKRNYSAQVVGRAAADDRSVRVYGSTRFAYRFTLISPETGAPWPNRPFRLFAKSHHLPSRQPSKKVFHGVTDAQGKTPVFRMDRLIPDRGWVLMERIGDGPFGKSFLLKRSGTRSEPLGGYPYALVVCATPRIVYKGKTSAGGDTAYMTSNAPADMMLMIEGDDFSDANLTKVCDPDQQGSAQ